MINACGDCYHFSSSRHPNASYAARRQLESSEGRSLAASTRLPREDAERVGARADDVSADSLTSRTLCKGTNRLTRLQTPKAVICLILWQIRDGIVFDRHCIAVRKRLSACVPQFLTWCCLEEQTAPEGEGSEVREAYKQVGFLVLAVLKLTFYFLPLPLPPIY